MKKYVLQLTTGNNFVLESNGEDLYQAIKRGKHMLQIGNMALRKQTVLYVIPSLEEKEMAYHVTLNTGEVIAVSGEVDITQVVSQINDGRSEFTQVGDALFANHIINLVTPA